MLVMFQTLTYYCGHCETDLMLEEEKTFTHSSWESWAYIDAKRRTLNAPYYFEWLYCRMHHIPTYPCRELEFVPALQGRFYGAQEPKKNGNDPMIVGFDGEEGLVSRIPWGA